jgi:hypothetical protein
MTLTTALRGAQRTGTPQPLWARPDGPWVPRRRHVLLGFVLVAVAVAATVFVVERAEGAHYQATIEQITPWGSSQLIVTLQVKNLGGAPESPTCRVDMNSPAYAFTGGATMSAHRPIPAGSTATYDVIVPVTDGGATHMDFNTSNVDCR